MRSTIAIKQAQKKYNKKYHKGVLKSYSLKCHKEHDNDIIAVLESQDNKSGYIKRLIRDDINRLQG